MSDISLVGGLLLGSLRGLTAEGIRAVEAADLILYPGDWAGADLTDMLGSRLRRGRDLRADDVLEAASAVGRLAVLFSGAPPLASGRGQAFPNARRLQALLQEAGHRVRTIPGVSAVQLAAIEAGLDLSSSDMPAFTIVSLEVPVSGLSALRECARTGARIALIWFEDHALHALRVLEEERPGQHLALVRNLGSPDLSTNRGSTEDLRASLGDLQPPAVLFSDPAPRVPADTSRTDPVV